MVTEEACSSSAPQEGPQGTENVQLPSPQIPSTDWMKDLLPMPTAFVERSSSSKRRHATKSRVLTADEFIAELKEKQKQEEIEAKEKEMRKQERLLPRELPK